MAKILEAGRWAASAGNSQPWSFVVFTDPEVKRRVTKCFNYGWFLNEAPVGIMIVVDPRASSCPIQDGSLAAGNMMLAAHALGLGTCWINPGLNDAGALEVLGIPPDRRIICVLSLGYPAETPDKMRKKLQDMAFSGKWGERF
jgi:nitroreductase